MVPPTGAIRVQRRNETCACPTRPYLPDWHGGHDDANQGPCCDDDRQDETVNELTFQRWDYTLRFRRNLQNRWRAREPERIDMIVPVMDGMTVKDILDYGGFAGLPAYYVEPFATHWGGSPNYGDDGWWAIIDGGCGVVGCCGVQADITVDDKTVRWSHFKIGTRNPDDRAYVFDRTVYLSAINGISHLRPIPVAVGWLARRVGVTSFDPSPGTPSRPTLRSVVASSPVSSCAKRSQSRVAGPSYWVSSMLEGFASAMDLNSCTTTRLGSCVAAEWRWSTESRTGLRRMSAFSSLNWHRPMFGPVMSCALPSVEHRQR